MVYYFSLFTLALCTVLFTYNSKVNRNILYLLGFLIPLAIYGILHHLVFFNDSAYKLALINVQLMPIYYLIGPMLYFYIRNTINDNYLLTKKDLIHFIPFTMGLISVLPYIFQNFEYKLDVAQNYISNPGSIKTFYVYSLYPNHINVIARPLLLFGYSITCMILIWRYSNLKSKQSPIAQKQLITKWLISLSIISFLVAVLYLSMTYIFFKTENFKKDVFNQLTISSYTGIAYAIIPIMMLIFPGILYGIPLAASQNENEENQILEIKNPTPEDLKSDDLTTSQLIDPLTNTAKRILEYFEKNKPYLNTEFSIDDIAEELNIPKHHVGYCFTNIIKTKFTSIRNDFRIEHAKRLLLSPQVDIMTVEGIGFESGFASKSSFFSVFKESTGLSPFDYMKQHKNQGSYRKFPKNHSKTSIN
ncbi:helix-turn-helix domain-containing protein [Daejeonella sp.]|uniref:helix-turn-helix domain-containing protein n=1 Tax=Daejeonella sp. TaxID=2805397 RepID=UPI0037BF18AA